MKNRSYEIFNETEARRKAKYKEVTIYEKKTSYSKNVDEHSKSKVNNNIRALNEVELYISKATVEFLEYF